MNTDGTPQGLDLRDVTITTTREHARTLLHDATEILKALAHDKAAEVTGCLQAGELGRARDVAGQLATAIAAAREAHALHHEFTSQGEKHDEQD